MNRLRASERMTDASTHLGCLPGSCLVPVAHATLSVEPRQSTGFSSGTVG